MKIRKSPVDRRARSSAIFPVITIVTVVLITAFTSFYEDSWMYKWSGIRKQIKDTVQIASEYGRITSNAVGYAGRKPQQYDRRFWIMENSTSEELMKLTDYPSGTVKAIAYEGLIYKSASDNRIDIILKAINDTSYPVGYISGCIGETFSIGEYILNNVLYLREDGPPFPRYLNNRFDLTSNDIKFIIENFKRVQATLDSKK